MTESSNADRILHAWIQLESALRDALPVCSVQPPTQPSELLSALRINHRIGAEEEARVLILREERNRVAHAPGDPPRDQADRFEAEATALRALLSEDPRGTC